MRARKTFYLAHDDGVTVYIRVTPNAGRNEIAGLWRAEEDGARLSAKVAAPPDKGKANAALIKLLAGRFGLPKSALSVSAGETSRLKTVLIQGDPSVLTAILNQFAGEDHGR